MATQDTQHDAEYYHKVVDCQYACPAHTPVPLYIRLIAEGRYTEAYLVNRESNVFPGVLGRVCDRPCEPACRRGRVDAKPVAICRLKRVAADLRTAAIEPYLPAIPEKKNGKKIALIGAGPASLTVINDLLPLGYECTLFEKESQAGGAMRLQVPQFRLPVEVLDAEISMILDRGGVKCHFGHEVRDLSALLPQFDALFLGTGAPLGKDLPLPGRREAAADIHIGLDFLAAVSFGHLTSLPAKVLVIGGGNTAMDCCRTAKRLGAVQVEVVAPEAEGALLASPWEVEDALAEGVALRHLLLPHEFVSENGRLSGVTFQRLSRCYDASGRWAPLPSGEAPLFLACDAVIIAIGQEVALPFVGADLGLERSPESRGRLFVAAKTQQTSLAKVFVGGDAAWGPKNIITAVAQGHEAALSLHLFCQGLPLLPRPPLGMSLVSQKMALNQWSYSNDYDLGGRQAVPHVPLAERLRGLEVEVETGFSSEAAWKEAQRCLNCDVQTVFTAELCLECDACVDICPVACLLMAPAEEAVPLKLRPPGFVLSGPDQAVLRASLPQTPRLMYKDENLCLHCGLCAERCPTAAWDMQAFSLQLPRASGLGGGGCSKK